MLRGGGERKERKREGRGGQEVKGRSVLIL
jgi:hypothetical protein